jgi:hypothetical protein
MVYIHNKKTQHIHVINSHVFIIDSGEVLTSTLTDLTLRSKETSISMLLNSTAGKIDR